MERLYFKRGTEKCSYMCDDLDRLVATIEFPEGWVSNPTVEKFCTELGWEEYTPEPPAPYVPTYEEKVVALIREQYDENSEAKFSRWNIEVNILHTKTLTAEELAELTTYSEYVAWCHEEAKKNE